MWAQKTKSGKWQYVERYTDPVTMKQKKVSVTLSGHSAHDIKTAQYALTAKIKAVADKNYGYSYVTLQELKSAYIEWKYANLKEQTAVSSEFKLNKVVELLGKDSRIDKLTAPYCKEKLFTEIPTKYNERLTHFKAMMRWGYQNDYIRDISFLDKMPKKKVPAARIRDREKYLEHEEIDKLLPECPTHWRLLTQFLILSGLRVGEAIALDVADVGDEILVTKTFSAITKKMSTVKTETSERAVYVQDELRECIKEIDEYRRTVCKRTGKVTSIFLPSVNGNRVDYYGYCKFLKEKSQAVLGRQLTPHALRHTHTALLAEQGIPLAEISMRLGHADSKVTRDVYMHVTERMKDKANKRLKKVKLIRMKDKANKRLKKAKLM